MLGQRSNGLSRRPLPYFCFCSSALAEIYPGPRPDVPAQLLRLRRRNRRRLSYSGFAVADSRGIVTPALPSQATTAQLLRLCRRIAATTPANTNTIIKDRLRVHPIKQVIYNCWPRRIAHACEVLASNYGPSKGSLRRAICGGPIHNQFYTTHAKPGQSCGSPTRRIGAGPYPQPPAGRNASRSNSWSLRSRQPCKTNSMPAPQQSSSPTGSKVLMVKDAGRACCLCRAWRLLRSRACGSKEQISCLRR